MHRALLIPEIILHIIAQIQTPRTLRSLALVCRFFEAPALDALWRDPGDDVLYHILKCFPANLLRLSHLYNAKITVTMSRPLVAGDWERPVRHCQRVRKLRLGMQQVDKYSEALSVLSILLPGDYLFPRLRSLHWNGGIAHDTAQSVAMLRMLVTSELSSLEFSGCTLLMLSSLSTLICRAPLPHLTVVDIQDRSPAATLADNELTAVSLFARTLKNVVRLHLPGLDEEALLHLGGMPNLASLKLDEFPTESTIMAAVPDSSFVSLRELNLANADLSAAGVLMSFLEKSKLEKLEIQPNVRTSTDDISNFYEEMEACLPDSLRDFSHNHSEVSHPPQEDLWRIHSDALEYLCSWYHLRTLSLSSGKGFEGLDDDALRSLVESFPCLTSLKLLQPKVSGTRLTLHGLFAIAENCSDLEELAITLDTTHIPSIRPRSCLFEDGDDRLIHTELRTLRVGMSRITDALGVASFLSAIFGELHTVTCEWGSIHTGESSTMCKRWSNVQDWAPRFALIRDEERDWAEYEKEKGDGSKDGDEE